MLLTAIRKRLQNAFFSFSSYFDEYLWGGGIQAGRHTPLKTAYFTNVSHVTSIPLLEFCSCAGTAHTWCPQHGHHEHKQWITLLTARADVERLTLAQPFNKLAARSLQHPRRSQGNRRYARVNLVFLSTREVNAHNISTIKNKRHAVIDDYVRPSVKHSLL